MKYITIEMTDSEYEMLKDYAAARRKHEIGKGFTIGHTIAQMVSIGLEAISETIMVDKNGQLVEWNTQHIGDEMCDKRKMLCSNKAKYM